LAKGQNGAFDPSRKSSGDPTMFARIGIMRALNRGKALPGATA
jgi:hypothetical protein